MLYCLEVIGVIVISLIAIDIFTNIIGMIFKC